MKGTVEFISFDDYIFTGIGQYRSAATAYEYAKCWLALAPEAPDAQKLVRDCEEYLEEERALKLDLKERAEIIRRETPDDAKGVFVNEQ